jgi:serine phosphatase RsbU (regulator of sigma subunit)
MRRLKIIIVAGDASRDHAAARRHEFASQWPVDEPAEFIARPADRLREQEIDEIDAVILVAQHIEDLLTLGPIRLQLEDAGIPVMLLLADSTAMALQIGSGALVDCWSSSTNLIAAKLIGLLHRHREVRQLRRELAMAERFQGGLQGEIERMHDELQLAAVVQRDFIPRDLPHLHGMEFSVLWRPANYVSGDIYEIVQLDEDHVGVFVADAVGHGVPAALMTMVICRSLVLTRSVGTSVEVVPPSEVLGRLNASLIQRQGRTTRFATAVYATINCRERRVTLAGAGHPPPLLLRQTTAVESLETAGGLLGVFADERFEEISVELAEDDRLLLFSDGFEQAFPAGRGDRLVLQRPTRRYLDEFARLIDAPDAHRMTQLITAQVDQQAGSLHQSDDLTLIGIRAGPRTLAASAPRRHAAPKSRIA